MKLTRNQLSSHLSKLQPVNQVLKFTLKQDEIDKQVIYECSVKCTLEL